MKPSDQMSFLFEDDASTAQFVINTNEGLTSIDLGPQVHRPLLLNDPQGHYVNHYHCCGDDWTVQHNSASADLCPNCLSLVEPVVSDDGSLTKQQIENALLGARMQAAFGTNDERVSESVFNGLISQLSQTHFEPEACDSVNY